MMKGVVVYTPSDTRFGELQQVDHTKYFNAVANKSLDQSYLIGWWWRKKNLNTATNPCEGSEKRTLHRTEWSIMSSLTMILQMNWRYDCMNNNFLCGRRCRMVGTRHLKEVAKLLRQHNQQYFFLMASPPQRIVYMTREITKQCQVLDSRTGKPAWSRPRLKTLQFRAI